MSARCMVIHTILLIPDVKFIASPPSMVAAGSLVASVKGLQMRIVGNAMTAQNLTENLAQIIRSDPVSLALYSRPFSLSITVDTI